MKKEVGLAVILGLVVGLIITIGIFRARRAVVETFPTESAIPVQAATPIPAATSLPQASDIALTIPTPDMLTDNATLQVSGKTTAHATVVILQENKESIGTADEQGSFSVPITLTAGGNILTIRVHKPNGSTSQMTRSVVFSSADLANTNAQTASGSPKPKVATPSPTP